MNKSAKLYSGLALVILSGIYLSTLFFGKLPLDTISPLVSFASFLLLFLFAKSWKDLIFSGLVYALLVLTTNSLPISTAWVCIYSAILLGSYVITVGDKIQIAMLLLTAPIVYGTSWALTGNLIISLASLTIYPAMLFLGFCTRLRVNRKNSIIYTSFGLGLSSALLIFVAMVKHSVSLGALKSTIEGIKDSVVKYMSEYTINTVEGPQNLFVEAEYIEEYVNGLVNILPGTAVVLIVLWAFMTQSALFSSLKKERLIEYMTSDVTEIQVSGMCAGIYLVAFVLSFTTNSEGNLMLGSVVMQNIYLALTPALAYVSISGINSFFRKRKMRPGFLLIIPAALLVIYGILSVALAFLGATIIIISKAKKYADEPKGKENGK